MKPVENYEAEAAFKNGKHIFVIDDSTKELIYLNAQTNKNFIVNIFSQPGYTYYIFK